jgi:hypothetical protein
MYKKPGQVNKFIVAGPRRAREERRGATPRIGVARVAGLVNRILTGSARAINRGQKPEAFQLQPTVQVRPTGPLGSIAGDIRLNCLKRLNRFSSG